MTTEDRKAALEEFDKAFVIDPDGQVHYKYNQYGTDYFLQRHAKIIRASLSQDPAPLVDAAYKERNQVVAALAKCFPSGVSKTAIEGWDKAWHNCVYIDLPTGQASWHFHDRDAYLFDELPAYQGTWDGHSTPEKYERLHALKLTAAWQKGEK